MPLEWSGPAARSTLIVAAHPDDETIGMGGQLTGLRNPILVHVTDGAPRSAPDPAAYARARREELLDAVRLAGISPRRTREIGLADQEAALHLAELTRSLAELFSALQPEAVFTHPYEGGHPDHDATAFAVHAACRLAPTPPPVYEFTSYHSRDGRMETGCFLRGDPPAVEILLSPEMRRLKQRMFDCFVSQQEMLRNFPVAAERFRRSPEYDFTAPPHPGTLFYENFQWGMTGRRFRAMAGEALEALALVQPL